MHRAFAAVCVAGGRTTAVALVDAYPARIAAYDQAGPKLNAMIRVNPAARSDAAALDAERRAGKIRRPLHEIPVTLGQVERALLTRGVMHVKVYTEHQPAGAEKATLVVPPRPVQPPQRAIRN